MEGRQSLAESAEVKVRQQTERKLQFPMHLERC